MEPRIEYVPGVCRLDEVFLGGFMSGFLSRGLTRVGYGLYFTTGRLFGIDPGSHGGSLLTGSLGGYIQGQLMPNLSPEESTKVIQELDRVKDFDLAKGQIRRVEIKRPGLTSGHIVITPSIGSPVKITLRHRIAFDRLMQLTQAFSPGIVDLS